MGVQSSTQTEPESEPQCFQELTNLICMNLTLEEEHNRKKVTDIVEQNMNIVFDKHLHSTARHYGGVLHGLELTYKEGWVFYLLLEYKFYDLLEKYLKSSHYDSKKQHACKKRGSYLIATLKAEQPQLARLIVAKGNYLPDAFDDFNDTALIYACCKGYADIALKILETGCDIIKTNNSHRNALFFSIQNGLDKVTDIMIRQMIQDPAIMARMKKSSSQTMGILLEVACLNGTKRFINFLLKIYSYNPQYVLPIYKKATKDAKTVIHNFFDIPDKEFLLEKYGLDKIETICKFFEEELSKTKVTAT